MSVVALTQKPAAEAFAEQMLEHVHGAAVTMMTAIGYRTRLFEALAESGPSTSGELARAASLEERYVREWLAAMTAAGVIHYAPETRKFTLPADHALSLTATGGPQNLGPLAQLMTAIGAIEDKLVEAFAWGGGVRFTDFPRIDQVIADSTAVKLESVLEPSLRLAPSLVERLEEGIDVLDLGCGEGRPTILMAQRFPKSRFTGLDLSARGIESARNRASSFGIDNVRFEMRDAAMLGERQKFDLVVTFDSIHDQADPAAVLRNIHRALRPGGVYLMVEPDASSRLENNLENPLATIMYTISCFHCMTSSLAADGAGLGAMWGREKASELLRAAGFTAIRVERLEGDPINAYFVMNK